MSRDVAGRGAGGSMERAQPIAGRVFGFSSYDFNYY